MSRVLPSWAAQEPVVCRHNTTVVMDTEGVVRHVGKADRCDGVPRPVLMTAEGRREQPVYTKFTQQHGGNDSTEFWGITVDEGWRTWVLCADMYEWAADGLLEVLRKSDARWPR